MSCQIFRDELTNEVKRVVAPNGESSILFRSIMDTFRPSIMEEYANPYFVGVDNQRYQSNPRTSYFNELSKLIYASLPKIPSDHTRMWRGSRKTDIQSNTTVTNALIGIALPFGDVYDGILQYVDVPTSDITKYENFGVVAKGNEFTLPDTYASKMKIVDPAIYASIKKQYPKGLLNFDKQNSISREQAVDLWATAYTPSFLLKFGDWVSLDRAKRMNDTSEISRLESQVSTSIDENGEPTISSLEDYYSSSVNPKDSNSILRSKIDNFLTSIGVTVLTAKLPSGVEAQAELLNNIIKVANNQVSPTILGEEAAHFFVSMLPTDSALLRDMMNKVVTTQVYRDVLQSYVNNPQYVINNKPNFDKLKKEAIGKLIAERMKGLDSEAPKSWWDRLLDWVKNHFNRKNPFLSSAEDILSSKVEGLSPTNIAQEDNIMYSLTSAKDSQTVYDDITNINSRMEKKESSDVDIETGKRIDKYYLDGKEIQKRVTNLVKDFYKKVFPNQQIDDEKREMYNIQAEKGTAIHSDIDNIIGRMINEDGTLKDTISERPKVFNTSESIYNTLEQGIITRIQSLAKKYGEGTRFITEVKIADINRNIAGTVDLLVIKPNGRVDIYDWKSSDFGGRKPKSMPWWKEEAYTIQLDEYAKILKSAYGVETDLKRAIPIRAVFSENPDTKKKTILSSIEIGSHVVQNIGDNKQYLLPVPSRTEKTGTKTIDDLLDTLRGLYNKIKDRKATLEERYVRNQELEKIKKAINDIQLKGSLDGLVENGNLLLNNVQRAINDNTLTLPQAQLYYKEVLLYSDLTKIKTAMGNQNFTDQDNRNIYSLSGRANEMENTLKEWLSNAGNEIANTVGVNDVDKIEKQIGFWAGTVRSLSNTPNSTVQAFYKYLVKYQDDILEQRNKVNNELTELRTELEEWGKSKGLTSNNLFDGMLEIDDRGRWNGSFLNKYTREFLDQKKKAIDDGDIKKLEELLDLSDEAKKRFEERKAGYAKFLNSTEFSLNKEKNDKIRENKLEQWNYQNNVFDNKYKKSALLNYSNGILGKEKYVTQKWTNLHSDNSNSPLLKVYNYFQSQLNYADKELGMIDNSGKFIPNIENDKLDMWAQYGNASIFNLKGFFESFEYKTNNTVGELDPVTGKPKKSVPKLFLNNLGQGKVDEDGDVYMDYTMKSRDLFTVFSLWGKHMAEYEYMSKLEEVGSLMLTIEDIKGKHLEKGKDGKYIEVQGNAKNYEYLDDFMNYYVYGQKMKDANAWEFDLFGKHYAGKSVLTGAIRYMGLKTLAVNTTSIIANYVGGKFNTYFVASKGKFLNKRQWAFGEYALSQDKGKALIEFFDVFLEDESYKKAKSLSVYDSVKKLNYIDLFVGQRLTDKWVQYPVLLGMTQSYGIIDNQIVNIKEYVQAKNNYNNIYNLPADEQKALLNIIDTEIKALEDKSIYNQATIDDKGHITLPGLEKGDKTILDFRSQVRRANKTILGNATSEDISRYRMSLLGQAVGQFRNWMPALIDERFGELRYNVDIEGWQKGKARVFFDNYFTSSPDNQSISKQALEILTKHIGTLIKDFIGFTSTSDIQSRAKILYAKEKARAVEQGLDFNISEHEYIELHQQNLRSMLNELRLILTFTAAIFAVSAAVPPDQKKKGIAKYVTRMLDKFNNELLFYYNPVNFTQLTQSPIPAIGLLEDIFKFTGALAGQGYATFTNNDKLDKKYKPTKYILKDVPIAREIYTLGTIFDEDMRRAYEVTR